MKLKDTITILSKYGKLIIAIAWLFSVFIYLKEYGVFTHLEAAKYINEANLFIKAGTFSATRFIFYSATIFIIVFALKINIGLIGAFIIQALVNIFAYLVFYNALKKVFVNSLIPLFIILYLLAFWPYQSWIVYLYTESVFYSSILLLLTALIENSYNKKLKTFFFVILVLILVILARPLGILFIIPVLLHFFVSLKKQTRFIIIPFAILGIILLIYISNIIFSTTNDATITLAASQECIICGVHPPVHSVIKLSNEGSPFFQLCYYLKNNFGEFLKLGITRLRYFFLMTRNYYSVTHNIFLLIFIIPLYLLSIISLFIPKEKNYWPLYLFQLSSILFFALAIMLQCDDFHNRFILALFPFFLVMSAKTIEYYFIKYGLRNRN